MNNLIRFVGVRYLRTHPLRSCLVILGVALGIALFVAIELINRSTLSSFRENVEAVAGKAKWVVSAGEVGFPEEKLDTIRKIPGVRSAVPMIESRAYFTDHSDPAHEKTETLMVLGVDLLQEQAIRTYKTTDERVIEDPLIFMNQPDSIIVTHAFAQKHGFKMDSTFVLATARGTRKFTIRGMLSPEGPARAFGGSLAIMDIDGARVTFGKEGKIDRVDIVTRDGDDPRAVDEVGERIRQKLGPGYWVERPAAQSASLERMVQSYQTMMTFFSSLALLVGLFLVANSVSISVAERRKEIGTLRAMGTLRRNILLLFLSEAGMMGAFGAFLGAGMGRVLASSLVNVVSKAMSSQYLTKIEVTRLHFGAPDIFRAVGLGFISAVLAAAWPAYRASTIQPLEAMKKQNLTQGWGGRDFFALSAYIGWPLLVFVTLGSCLKVGYRFPILENFNQFFSILGAVLVGPSSVLGMVRIFRSLTLKGVGRHGSITTRFAQDNLIRNPQRTGSNVISLMVGLILVILISAVSASFKTTIVGWFERVLKSDLIISSAGEVITYQAQPLHENLAEEIARIPGIRKDFRSAFGVRLVHVRYGDASVALKAYDEPHPDFKYSNLDLLDRPVAVAGYELYHSSEPVLFVSENFAAHFAKTTQDTLELDSPSGRVQFRIIGRIVDFSSDVGVLYMSREVYKKFWKDPLVNAFGVQVMPGFAIETVRQNIDVQLGQARNLIVTSNAELKAQMVQTIDQTFAYTHAIEIAALGVGLLGLFNTLLMSVMERTQEIGMLRAVGMTRSQISRMILQESLLQGGFGAIMAVLLGSWFAYIWISNSLSFVLGWIVQFHFPWTSVGTTVLTGLAIAWLAGLLPARRAAHMEITEALEYE